MESDYKDISNLSVHYKINMKKILFCVFLLTTSCASTLPAGKLKSVHDLPLQLSESKGINGKLVIYLTGDGGWNDFSQKLTHEFEKEGYGVISLNTRKYFRIKQTPNIFAQDIEYLVNYYMREWEKTSVIIVGYSFGADVAAFLPRRLPSYLLDKIDNIALLSPSLSTDFVINLSDLIGDSKHTKRKYKLGPELNKTTFPIVCIFGVKEDLNLKNILSKRESLTIHELPGNHHYKYNTALIIKMIGL
jgi:type IV secretory pathway VirJ component